MFRLRAAASLNHKPEKQEQAHVEPLQLFAETAFVSP
jgi:hypothetical protein